VFRHAAQLPPFDDNAERTRLALACRNEGAKAGTKEIAALAQAKIAFVERTLEVCSRHKAIAFASIVPKDAPRPSADYLRKDYSFLFQRFYLLLKDHPAHCMGLVVFDELKRSRSHLLIDQMERYFVGTSTGKRRSSPRIIPEPFFVHSHLTTGVQLTDIVAYVISWGVRETGMTAPRRVELAELARLVCQLRHNQVDDGKTVWGFNVIKDLRPRLERGTTAVAGAFLRAWDSSEKKKGNAGQSPAKPPNWTLPAQRTLSTAATSSSQPASSPSPS
jgi:hypothetical protein